MTKQKISVEDLIPLSVEQIVDMIMDNDAEYGDLIREYVYIIIKNDANRKNSWDAWFRGASAEWIARYDNNLYDPKDDKWRKHEREQTSNTKEKQTEDEGDKQ